MIQNYLWFIYALGAAVLWGIQYVVIEQLSKTVPTHLMTLIYTAMLTLVYIGVFTALGVDLRPEKLQVYFTSRNLLLFGIVIFVGCGSTLLTFAAIATGTAARASIIEITYPVFVTVFTALVYGQASLTTQFLIGSFLILAGVGLVLKG